MSRRKSIIEVAPPRFQELRESIILTGYLCPVCNGRGQFDEEIGREEYRTIACDYCQGTGRVRAEVLISWKPDV